MVNVGLRTGAGASEGHAPICSMKRLRLSSVEPMSGRPKSAESFIACSSARDGMDGTGVGMCQGHLVTRAEERNAPVYAKSERRLVGNSSLGVPSGLRTGATGSPTFCGLQSAAFARRASLW